MKYLLIILLPIIVYAEGYTAKDAAKDAKIARIKNYKNPTVEAGICKAEIISRIKSAALEGKNYVQVNLGEDTNNGCDWGLVPELIEKQFKADGYKTQLIEAGIDMITWNHILTVGW